MGMQVGILNVVVHPNLTVLCGYGFGLEKLTIPLNVEFNTRLPELSKFKLYLGYILMETLVR